MLCFRRPCNLIGVIKPARTQVWKEFLPQAKLFFLEYDAICADKWRPKIESAGATLYTGDQANKTLLQQIVLQEGRSGLDVIIDDGGHTMQQQLTSLQFLWELIRPGGFYVIEDLGTSYMHDYGGDPLPGAPSTTISYVKSLLDFLICKDADDTNNSLPFCKDKQQSLQNLLSFHCFSGVCAFFKATS